MSRVRRFDRDKLLYGLAQLSRGWNGNPFDDAGNPKPNLPWNIAGAANVILGRGTVGGRHPSLDDCSSIAHEYSGIEPPNTAAGTPDVHNLVARWVYQQWPFNRFDRSEWARTLALFFSTDWPDGYAPKAMKAGWDVELLAAPISDFVSVAMLLWASANQGARYPFPWERRTETLRAGLGGQDRIDAIVHHNFTTTLEDFKAARLDAIERIPGSPGSRYMREPFAFNPLFATPYVGGILDGEWLAPCAPVVSMRVGAAGVAYAGVQRWGIDFFHDLGHLFEQYIGRHLRLLAGAEVHPEITYTRRKESAKTVDWFVETPDAVFLIECKSALPNRMIREGDLGLVDAHATALDKGIRQLNRSRDLLLNRQTELGRISSTKPLIGILTTLGNFDLADKDFVQQGLPKPAFPIAIMSVDFIERFAMLDPEDVSRAVSSAGEHVDTSGFLKPSWTYEFSVERNPILAEAFDSIPIVKLAKEIGVPIDD